MFQHHLGISPRPTFVELRPHLNLLATQMSQEFGNFTQEEWYNRVVHFYNNNISKTGHRARLGNFIRQAEHIGQDVTQAEILGLDEAGQLHDFELIGLRRSAWFSSRAEQTMLVPQPQFMQQPQAQYAPQMTQVVRSQAPANQYQFAPQQYAAQPQVQYVQAPQAQTQAQYVQQPPPQLQQQPQVQYMPQAQATMVAQPDQVQYVPGQSPVPMQAPMQYGASQVPSCPHSLVCPTLEQDLSRGV